MLGKGGKGILQTGSRGQRAVRKTATGTRSPGFGDTTHVTRRHACSKALPLCPAQTESGPGAILSDSPDYVKGELTSRGEWLQVTKELHPEGQSKLLLTLGCRLGRGKWENDRIQG